MITLVNITKRILELDISDADKVKILTEINDLILKNEINFGNIVTGVVAKWGLPDEMSWKSRSEGPIAIDDVMVFRDGVWYFPSNSNEVANIYGPVPLGLENGVYQFDSKDYDNCFLPF